MCIQKNDMSALGLQRVLGLGSYRRRLNPESARIGAAYCRIYLGKLPEYYCNDVLPQTTAHQRIKLQAPTPMLQRKGAPEFGSPCLLIRDVA